jgi:ATP-dependent helicase/nuclease subunit A
MARAGIVIRPSALPDAPVSFEARAGLVARMEGTVDAMERGRIIHRLLEALPAHDPSKRREIAERFLTGTVPAWPASEREALASEVLAVLGDARFGPVFAPGSLAEVDIAAEIAVAGETAALSGRIDRLAITEGEILVVDYKTNRPAPIAPEGVPEAYLSQLALYRHGLRRIYPGRAVACAILWTNVPALMPIPSPLLDAAEAKLLAPPAENGGNPAISDTVT